MDLSFLDKLCDAQMRPVSVKAGWFLCWRKNDGAVSFTDAEARSVYFEAGQSRDNKRLAPWIRNDADFEELVKAVALRIGRSYKAIPRDGGERALYLFV
jgi:hypothetical protein